MKNKMIIILAILIPLLFSTTLHAIVNPGEPNVPLNPTPAPDNPPAPPEEMQPVPPLPTDDVRILPEPPASAPVPITTPSDGDVHVPSIKYYPENSYSLFGNSTAQNNNATILAICCICLLCLGLVVLLVVIVILYKKKKDKEQFTV